jgi:hypothetical protein
MGGWREETEICYNWEENAAREVKQHRSAMMSEKVHEKTGEVKIYADSKKQSCMVVE